MDLNSAQTAITAAAAQVGLKAEFAETSAAACCIIVYISTGGDTLKVAGLRYRAKKMQAILSKSGFGMGALQDNSGYNNPAIATRIWFPY